MVSANPTSCQEQNRPVLRLCKATFFCRQNQNTSHNGCFVSLSHESPFMSKKLGLQATWPAGEKLAGRPIFDSRVFEHQPAGDWTARELLRPRRYARRQLSPTNHADPRSIDGVGVVCIFLAGSSYRPPGSARSADYRAGFEQLPAFANRLP